MVRLRPIILWTVFGCVVLVGVLAGGLALGQVGAQRNVQDSRAACYRSIPRNVAAINSIRAQVVSDQIAAADPGVPVAVRKGRRNEIAKDTRYVLVLDSQTDQSAWRKLDYQADRHAVQYGVHRNPPFSCVRAYPQARFLP